MTRRLLISLALVALAAAALAVPALGKAPQTDWPRINGQVWLNVDSHPIEHHGGNNNDKLLGGHAGDRLFGHQGGDVLWGDYRGQGNNSWQQDVLVGGPGRDYIYASHGRSEIRGGSGRDTIRVWFGRGTVDCGRGYDTLYTSKRSNPHVKKRGCERVSHLSAAQVEARR